MSILQKYTGSGGYVSWVFWCPGCDELHPFQTAGEKGPRWTMSGTPDRPTFRPSLVVGLNDPKRRCHLFVEDGRIRFLSDCHHDLAGQTVDMVHLDGQQATS